MGHATLNLLLYLKGQLTYLSPTADVSHRRRQQFERTQLRHRRRGEDADPIAVGATDGLRRSRHQCWRRQLGHRATDEAYIHTYRAAQHMQSLLLYV